MNRFAKHFSLLISICLAVAACRQLRAEDAKSAVDSKSTADAKKTDETAKSDEKKVEQPKPKDTPEAAAFQQQVDQWNALQAELAKHQIKLLTGSLTEIESAKSPYVELMKKLGAMQPALLADAEKTYLADENNTAAADLLFAMSVGFLRRDNYEEALRLAKMLIDHHYANKDVCRVAASAAMALMQLEDAKKYMALIAETSAPKNPPLDTLLPVMKAYGPKWEREEKFRQADAKADDLPRVKLHTTAGDMVIELFENEAPNTVANFIFLVENQWYDGTQFHRVLPNFMAQGGDPISKDPSKFPGREIGTGGPGYFIPCECYTENHREHFRGSLSMAHAGKDTGGSQFFLTFGPTSSLDGKHTVFGRVIDGIDVLSKIQRIDPEKKHGIEPDKIISAEVLRKRDHTYEPKIVGPQGGPMPSAPPQQN